MNAMKKWVVAGLIGLSSAGVSMAVPLVDNFSDLSAGGIYSVNYSGGNATVDPSQDNTRSFLVASSDNNGDVLYADGGGYIAFNGANAGVTFHSANQALDEGGTVADVYYRASSGYLKGFFGVTLDLTGDYSVGAQAQLYWDQDSSYINLTPYLGAVHTFYWTDVVWESFWGPGGDPYALSAVFLSPLDPNYNVATFFTVGFGALNGKGNETPNQYFTLKSFTLTDVAPEAGVPEPETVWMMLAVLGSLAVTFRGQLSDLARRFVKS